MTVRQTTFILRGTTAALLTASVLIIVAGIITPLKIPADAVRNDAVAPHAEPIVIKPISLTTLYTRTFRPSSDASAVPAPTMPVVTATAGGQEIQLIGTVGTALAIIRGPDGTDALAEVGDDVNGDVITAIRSSEMDIKTAHGIVTLHRAAEPETPVISPQSK